MPATNTAFDLDGYRAMLDQKLGIGAPPQAPQQQATAADAPPQEQQGTGRKIRDNTGDGMEPLPEPRPPNFPPFTDNGQGPFVEDDIGDGQGYDGGLPFNKQQQQSVGQRPGAGSAAPGPQIGGGGGAYGGKAGSKIPVLPEGFDPKFNEKALSKAKTPNDVIDAMAPKARSAYMDWWEQKYGEINGKWNQIQKELGVRPSEADKLNRQQKFGMLMEFGLNLIKNSGEDRSGNTPNLGVAAANATHDTIRGAQAKKQYDIDKYDLKSEAVHKGRAEELKGIGNYGEALKNQATIDSEGRQGAASDAQRAESERRTAEIGTEAPTTLGTDDGVGQWNRKTQQWEAVTIDGKRATNLKVGARGGVGKDSRTANTKNIEDLKDRGVPEELAVDIVYRRLGNDPRKAWQRIYDSARRRYDSESEAKNEADEIISDQFGEGWKDSTKAPAIQKDDPLGLRGTAR